MNYKLYSIFTVLILCLFANDSIAKVTPAKCQVDIKTLKKQGKLKKMNIKERKFLASVVNSAEQDLSFFKKKFKINLVYDCASMENIMLESEGTEKPSRMGSIRSMTSDIKTLFESASRHYTEEFDEAVKTVVVRAVPGLGKRGIKAELKDGVLTISRTSFRYGGYTTGDWKRWIESQL